MSLKFGSAGNSRVAWVVVVIVAAVTFGGVTRSKTNGARPPKADTVLAAALPTPAAPVESNPERNAYFGQTHIHTSWSPDAYIFGNTVTGPAQAYEFAIGQPIKHPAGYMVKIKTPLDFQGVTDHAEYVGVMRLANDPSSPISKLPIAKKLQIHSQADATEVFKWLAASLGKSEPPSRSCSLPRSLTSSGSKPSPSPTNTTNPASLPRSLLTSGLQCRTIRTCTATSSSETRSMCR
jgi:hypothetical protein